MELLCPYHYHHDPTTSTTNNNLAKKTETMKICLLLNILSIHQHYQVDNTDLPIVASMIIRSAFCVINILLQIIIMKKNWKP